MGLKEVKQTAATRNLAPVEPAKPKVVAVLDNEQIARDDLAKDACVTTATMLESLINKRLIEAACSGTLESP